MDNHLGVAVLALVELVVGDFGVVEPDLMRNDKARLGLARDDHVAQVAVVRLDVALAGAESKALYGTCRCQNKVCLKTSENSSYLFKELAEAQADHALGRGCVGCAGITA